MITVAKPWDEYVFPFLKESRAIHLSKHSRVQLSCKLAFSVKGLDSFSGPIDFEPRVALPEKRLQTSHTAQRHVESN